MPLVEIALPTDTGPIPDDVRAYLRDADARIDAFQQTGRTHAFVPSDYAGAYQVLRGLSAGVLTRGNRFCEWGSGFGVVAGLAAHVGFDSCGIEIDGELVIAARHLADDFGLEVEFAHGSFVPRGGESRVHATGAFAWLTTEGDDAYPDLGLEPDDFDVIFAYPWPDEEDVTGILFDRYAGVGAILLTYHGSEGYRGRRKVAGKRRR